MKFITEFRRAERVKGLVDGIHGRSRTRARLMEFCGGHTVTIFRYGIRQLLPSTVEMVSGPGCPVCVTANPDLDKAIALSRLPGVMVTTFGDMFKVPGSRESLQEAKARGSDIRMVYSTMDALDLARDNPDKKVVFIGIGFETTAPTVAASILQAEARGLENYSVLSLHKLSPPILRAILAQGDINLQGLICPGHVSAVIGAKAWDQVAREFHIPCVVAGFEPLDILQSVNMLVAQVEAGEARVETAYTRGVQWEGNPHAVKIMEQVFEPGVANWRGVGEVPGSGMVIRERYKRFDAEKIFEIDPGPTIEPKGCICGDVLRGVKSPGDCGLFRTRCTPTTPVGPCMVSSEGSCSAYYLYGEDCDG